MIYKSIKYISFFIILLLTACENNPFAGKLDEGRITYTMKYFEDEGVNPLISLLPTEMIIEFKDNSYSQKIEGWMGIFSMAGIYNTKTKTNSALLKIMSDKFHYETGLDGESFGFDSLPKMKIEYTNETQVIAGYKCKKAKIIFEDSKIKNFDVFYTTEISIAKPNNHNPFNEIKGVLLKYQMGFQDIQMEVTATKVEETKISDTSFEIPANYEKVPIEKMQEVLDNLM